MNAYGVVLFHTTSSAIRAEKALKKEGLAVRLIPVPRELSSDCGVSLRFDWAQRDGVQTLLEREPIEFASIHPLEQRRAS